MLTQHQLIEGTTILFLKKVIEYRCTCDTSLCEWCKIPDELPERMQLTLNWRTSKILEFSDFNRLNRSLTVSKSQNTSVPNYIPLKGHNEYTEKITKYGILPKPDFDSKFWKVKKIFPELTPVGLAFMSKMAINGSFHISHKEALQHVDIGNVDRKHRFVSYQAYDDYIEHHLYTDFVTIEWFDESRLDQYLFTFDETSHIRIKTNMTLIIFNRDLNKNKNFLLDAIRFSTN